MNKLDEFKRFRQGSRIEATKTQEDACKMFIRGIPLETSKQSLLEYMAQFGEIIDFTIKTHQDSGLSRGFGFVLFKDSATVEKVLQVKEHKVDGKIIELKRAKAMELKFTSKKIFVGGVSRRLSEEKIREYFESFGVVENIEFPVCPKTKERRSFCFVTYTNKQPVRKLVQTRFCLIGSRWCEIKLAHPKECGTLQYSRGGQVPFDRLGNRWGERGFAENPDARGVNPNVYVANRNAYRANPNVSGANRNVNVANPNAYGANPNDCVTNPNAYGANPNDYMANLNAYGVTPNGGGANPIVYVANLNDYVLYPNAYRASPNAYGLNLNDYVLYPNAYGAIPYGDSANPNVYIANPNAYGPSPYGGGANPIAYETNPNGGGANPNGSGANTDVYMPNLNVVSTNPYVYGATSNACGTNQNVCGAAEGNGGTSTVLVSVPFAVYNNSFNFSDQTYGNSHNGQPVFNGYGGEYFLDYNYGTPVFGTAFTNYNMPPNNAASFDNGHQGTVQPF